MPVKTTKRKSLTGMVHVLREKRFGVKLYRFSGDHIEIVKDVYEIKGTVPREAYCIVRTARGDLAELTRMGNHWQRDAILIEKGVKQDAIRQEISPTRAADAKSPKRAASRTKTVDGIKVAVSTPKHVRVGSKAKGGMETTVKIDIGQHAYAVKLELDEKPRRVFINNRIFFLCEDPA